MGNPAHIILNEQKIRNYMVICDHISAFRFTKITLVCATVYIYLSVSNCTYYTNQLYRIRGTLNGVLKYSIIIITRHIITIIISSSNDIIIDIFLQNKHVR